MANTNSRTTLYDDWQYRRDQLLLAPEKIDGYRHIQLRVLEFLLRRYFDSPVACRTVAAPHRGDVSVNDRAIIVHHHLGRRNIASISTAAEAHSHVKSVLERMYSDNESERPSFSPTERSINDEATDQIRSRLSHPNPIQRVVAAAELGEFGTLEDIGLLGDLLALPVSDDEHPRERAALSHTIARLAGVTSADFDLSVLGPPFNPPESVVEERTEDWVCSKCGEAVPANFEICWSCGTTYEGIEDPTFLEAPDS